MRGVVLATSQQHDLVSTFLYPLVFTNSGYFKVDLLEKRVKSRFSHRVYYMPTIKDTGEVRKILEQLLSIENDAASSIL